MTFYALLFLFLKTFTAFFCTVGSYINTRHITAPKFVWWVFFYAFLIWLGQTCVNGYFLFYAIKQSYWVHLLNDGVFQFIKLFLFMGAVVMMNQKYIDREQNLYV